MPNNLEQKVLLVGAGPMAIEYSKVLEHLKIPYAVLGRGEKSAKVFFEKTGIQPYLHGLDKLLSEQTFQCAINSVGVDLLYPVTKDLLQKGFKKILVEKPGGLRVEDLLDLKNISGQKSADVLIGYNRRFYESALHAKKVIHDDGGVKNVFFEFTEWGHVVGKLDKPQKVLENWFLANSTHVADLAFYLCGSPLELSALTSGSLSWHSRSSIFSGSGKTTDGALFSYGANWSSPGRWRLEIVTSSHRLIFAPIEEIQVQTFDTKSNYSKKEDSTLSLKPGLTKQVISFLSEEYSGLCTLEEQISLFPFYFKMAGY